MAASPSSTPLPERTQAPCCYTAAMDPSATYCGECGTPLIRCMAFEECGGLLDTRGKCTVCVAPQLQIEAGAMKEARVGGAVALPLSVTNASAIGRPLYVTALYSREGGGQWREAELSWERLHAAEQRPVTLRAETLERTGVHSIEILMAVANRWRWREERYAFTGTITLDITDDSASAGPVVNIGGESAGHGNTVYIAGQSTADDTAARTKTAIPLKLTRAERDERRLGLRGLGETGWIPRDVVLAWKGFPETETPLDGPILTSDGLLAAGRSRSRREGGLGDLRLLPETGKGAIDEDAARLISRRHFELYVECDRLILRVTGGGGVRVNGEAYGRDKTVVLHDGDTIAPLVEAPDALKLKTRFQAEHGRVGRVTFSRHPASQRKGA